MGSSRLAPLAGLMLLSLGARTAAAASDYPVLAREIVADRERLSRQWPARPSPPRLRRLERLLLARIDQLSRAWLGTRWGLGRPQSSRPGPGKINCGTFVARILRDAGFDLPVRKFNRQAASDAIRSIAPPRTIRSFRRTPMRRFLAAVKAMGPGLFVIGLDYHIGFLRQDPRGLRFVHASYYKGRVVDEPAAGAIDITSSRLRVVGKILQPRMLRAWLAGRRIEVVGGR